MCVKPLSWHSSLSLGVCWCKQEESHCKHDDSRWSNPCRLCWALDFEGARRLEALLPHKRSPRGTYLHHTFVLSIPLLMKNDATHDQPSYHYSCVFESVRWLVSQGKVSRAVKIIKTIAKFNGRKVAEDVFESFEVPSHSDSKLTGTDQNYLHSQRFAVSQQETFQQQEKKNVLTLFKSRRLRNRTILTIIAW